MHHMNAWCYSSVFGPKCDTASRFSDGLARVATNPPSLKCRFDFAGLLW